MSNRDDRCAAGSSACGSFVVAIVRMSSRSSTPSSVARKSASAALSPLESRWPSTRSMSSSTTSVGPNVSDVA